MLWFLRKRIRVKRHFLWDPTKSWCFFFLFWEKKSEFCEKLFDFLTFFLRILRLESELTLCRGVRIMTLIAELETKALHFWSHLNTIPKLEYLLISTILCNTHLAFIKYCASCDLNIAPVHFAFLLHVCLNVQPYSFWNGLISCWLLSNVSTAVSFFISRSVLVFFLVPETHVRSLCLFGILAPLGSKEANDGLCVFSVCRGVFRSKPRVKEITGDSAIWIITLWPRRCFLLRRTRWRDFSF